jgi:hypothetical protein
MKKVLSLAMIFSFVFLAACSSKMAQREVKITVLEKIPNIAQPKWVSSTAEFWEEKGSYFYRGMSEGMTNLEAARRAAGASAQERIVEQVKQVVRVEFSRALEGGAYDANTGAYLKNTFFSVVDNLTVSGIKIKETYTERLNEFDGINNKTYFRSYCLAEISQNDYKKLVANAFSKTGAQIKSNESAKEISAQVEKRFFDAQTAAQAANQ